MTTTREPKDTHDLLTIYEFAVALESYEVYGDATVAVAQRVEETFSRTGQWKGELSELCATLFMKQRAFHWSGHFPEGKGREELLSLYHEIRRRWHEHSTPSFPIVIKRVTLERTGCMGTCPVYTISLTASGRVSWHGEYWVEQVGQRWWTISQQQVENLAYYFERTNYFTLRDEYTNEEVSCGASCITTITCTDGRYKRVEHYSKDSSAPARLTALEKRIDIVVGTEQYIGKTE